VESAFPAHTVETFLQYDIGQLRQKRFMANLAIQTARGESEDERAPAALDYYLKERRLINLAMQEQMYEDGPPAQTMGMKPVSMSGAAKGGEKRRNVVGIEEFLEMFK